MRNFKKLPYIETIIHRANGHPTNHYRVQIEELKQDLNDLVHKDLLKTRNRSCENNKLLVDDNETLTKITTKITTKNLSLKVCAPLGMRQKTKNHPDKQGGCRHAAGILFSQNRLMSIKAQSVGETHALSREGRTGYKVRQIPDAINSFKK